MEWILLGVAVVSLALLVGLFRPRREAPKAPPEKGQIYRTCPLCARILKRGEKVHSTMFRHGGDRLMEIVGCPHCRTDRPKTFQLPLPRLCPVCRRALDQDETVPARVFPRAKGMHIHVLGCRVCRRVIG